MTATFPAALPVFTAIPAGGTQDVAYGGRTHSTAHTDEGDEIEAIATKVGYGGGTNTPFNKSVLNGSGAGTSGWTASPTVSGSYTVEGGLNVGSATGAGTGQVKASAGILPGVDTFAAGKLYTEATNGLVFGGKAGSSNDVMVANSAGGTILTVPTGATTVTFASSIDIGSGSFAAGRIYVGTTVNGLVLAGKTGSTSDLLITNRAGASVMFVDPNAVTVQHAGTFYPTTDNSFDLGTGSRHYRDVYCSRAAFNGSHSSLKRDIRPLEPREALAAVLATEIVAFRYRPTDNDDVNAEREQIGFIADGRTHDLLSPDHRTANPATTAGVALAAIQALAADLAALRGQISRRAA